MMKNKFLIKILIGLIIGIIVLLIIWFGMKCFYKNSKKENPISEKNGYKYKIRYDFGNEAYIHLFQTDVLTIYNKIPIVEKVESCNCVQATGEFEEVEKIIDFSKETKNEVIKVLQNLATKSGKTEFDARELNLTKYEQKILLAIMLNSEDRITIDKNLKFEKSVENFDSKNSEYKIENSRVVLNSLTQNKIVNNIANYLNDITNKDFNELNNYSKDIIENEYIGEDLGVALKIEKVYDGPYSVSFVYTKEGQLGATALYDIKGYTFDYNGNIKKFDVNGLKDEYYKDALNNFMNSELYINNNEQLVVNWETVLYENMFLNGNWYLKDDEIEFLIPGYILGFDDSTVKTVIIDVKNSEEF